MRSFSLKIYFARITQQGEKWVDRLAVLLFLLAVLLFPILCSPWSFDVLQLPKQSALFLLTGVFGLLWALRCVMTRSIVFPWDTLTKILLLATVGLGVSAVTSVDPVTSLLGMGSQIGQAWGSWVCLFLLFGFGRIFFASKRRQGLILGGWIGSAFLVSAVSILSWLHVFPKESFLSRPGFNPIGSSFDLVTFLLPIVGLILGCVVLNAPSTFFRRSAPRIALWGLMAVTLIFTFELFLLVDFSLVWGGVGLSSLGLLLIGNRISKQRFVPGMVIASAVLLFAIFSGAHHLPGSFATLVPFNPSSAIQNALAIQPGGEIVPNVKTSWQVSWALWKEHPLFGAGQGTWSYGYDRFHEIGLNLTPFWKTRFPHAQSFVLTLLPTTGVLSILILLVFGITFLYRARQLYRTSQEDTRTRELIVLFGLPLILIVVLSFARFLELSSLFLAWSLMAMLASLFPFERQIIFFQEERRPVFWTAGVVAALICLLIMLVPLPRMVADARYARGLASADQPEKAHFFFTSAHRWNPVQDSYLRAVAQQEAQNSVQLLQSNNEAQMKQGIARLHGALRLTQQASALNPANADHWLDGANIYRVFRTFDPELEQGVAAYLQEAQKRQPLNPQITYQMAQLSLERGQREQKWVEGDDARTKQEATERQADAFREARYWLEKSLALKENYTPARYDLAALNEYEGKKADAERELERVLKDDKMNKRVMVELGLLYAQDEKFEQSGQLFERFLQLEPNDTTVRWYLSAVYERLGRLDDAIVQLRLLLNQTPDDKNAQDRLQLLQRTKVSALVPETLPLVVSTSTTSTRSPVPTKKRR